MKKYFKEYISQNFKVLTILFICLIIGIVMGVAIYHILDDGVKTELINTMKSTLDLTKQENFQGINIIKNGMISNIILTLIIYLISLTLISPYLISILSITKGFAIGIYIPTLFQIFNFGNGIIAMILLIIIPNLVYIPSYVYMCTNSINFNYNLINGENKMSLIIKEIIKIVVGFSIMFLGVILEQFTSLGVISLYKKL